MKAGKFFKATSVFCLSASTLILSPLARAATAGASPQQLQQEIVKLEQQVSMLSGEVNQLKRQKPQTRYIAQNTPTPNPQASGDQQAAETLPEPQSKFVQQRNVVNQYDQETQAAKAESEIDLEREREQAAGELPQSGPSLTSDQPSYPHPGAPITKLQSERLTRGSTVTTSPYIGIRSAFDASDLVVNISTMNEDLRLLQQREKIEEAYRAANLVPFASDRPLLEISGTLEGQGIYQSPFQGHTFTTFTLSKAELDFLSYVSPWVLGIMTFDYDNTPLPALTDPNIQIAGVGQQIANSRIFLKRGFITFGDLHRFPLYLTLGQMFAPFGDYSNQMLTNPLTQQLGQSDNRMILLGLAPYQTGFYMEGFLFNGDSYVSNNTAINNGGGNIGYKHSNDSGNFGYNIGAGVIGNLADSLGMQNVGSPAFGGPPPNSFQGFGWSTSTEQIARRVPGADLHGELDVKKLTLVGEYIAATQPFDPNNLSFDGHGARPSASHLEGDYSFQILNWPSVFSLAYDHSWQSLAIFLPRNSYIAALTMSIFKDTIEEIEYRHDSNYSHSDFGSGNGFEVPVNAMGASQNTVTIQAGYYF